MYKFSPLPGPEHIRLVTIQPRRASEIFICGTPVIDFSLVTVALADAPDFDALSYTWGTPFKKDVVSWAPKAGGDDVDDEYDPKTNKWPVSINDKLLLVTKNLYEGLRRLQVGVTIQSTRTAQMTEGLDRQKGGEEALRYAADTGKIGEVRHLIRKRIDVTAKDDFGKTALHYAAENGFYETSKLLINAGSDASCRDESGRTPRDYATEHQRGDWEQASELLEAAEGNSRTIVPGTQKPLWVDAICINQDDAVERSAQVAIMSHIYSAAKEVWVWLGVEDDFTLPAIKTLRLMNSMPPDAPEWYWTANQHLNLPQDKVEDEAQEQIAKRNNWITKSISGFEALLALLDRAWFQRVWIMQEITMAMRVTLMCGSYSLSWDDLFRAVQRPYHPCNDPACNRGRLLSYKFSPAIKFNLGNRGSEAQILTEVRLRTRTDIEERRYLYDQTQSLFDGSNKAHFSTIWDNKISLSLLLACSWHFKAQDPRDKVFALLGMSRQEDRDKIVIDYELPVEQLYTSIAAMFLAGSGSDVLQDWKNGDSEGLELLEGLSFIQRSSIDQPSWPTRTSNLPSWVPDFNQPLISSRIFRPRFQAASSNLAGRSSFEVQGNVLKVQGFLLDRVGAVAEESHQNPGTNSLFFNLESWLRITHSLEPVYAATGQNRAEVLWRTLMLDETEPVGQERAKESFREWVEMFSLELYHSQRSRKLYDDLKATDDSNSLIELGPFVNEDEGKRLGVRSVNYSPRHDGSFYYLWVSVDLTRRLFTTRNGYMGLGPGIVEPGDVVVLIAGARTPYILRPLVGQDSPTRYSFIGEAYVHGVMNGEALDGREDVFEALELI